MHNLTIVGNLTADPELRFTATGDAVCTINVAVSERVLDKATNEWKDGPASFYRCTIWKRYAEHVAESLVKGNRVIVTGKMSQREYETREGEKRNVWEVKAEDVGVCLRYATAKPVKATSGSSGLSAPSTDSPWRTSAPSLTDEPPF